MAAGGEYDDVWARPVKAFHSLDKANEHMEGLKKHVDAVERLANLTAQFIRNYEEDHPAPVYPGLPTINNLAKCSAYYEAYAKWFPQRDQAATAYLQAMKDVDPSMIEYAVTHCYMFESIHYRVQELEIE